MNNNDGEQTSVAKSTLRTLIAKPLFKWAALLLLATGFYLGNTYVQSELGRETLANTGLNINSLEEALIKASASDKLVLANMTAIWCPSCRKLDREVFSDQQVNALINKDFVFARIEYDAEEGQAFMDKYRIYGFPTLLILNAQGEKLQHLPLTFDPKEFSAHLSKTLALRQAF